MYDLVSEALGLVKFDTINIDNGIFRLHYKATMFVLVAFSLLLTQKQYFGDPIDCISGSGLSLLDTYCWIMSTFTLLSETKGAHPGVGSAHPGIASGDANSVVKHHAYYQWVTLFLYMQALMFYIPRYLWSVWEGGKLKMLIEGLHLPLMNEEEAEAKTQFLISYLKMNWHKHNSYAFQFFLCELLNFVNALAQIYITDAFVGYEFTNYGLKFLEETESTLYARDDNLEYVFPKVTKCTYRNFGPSGTPQIIDAICVLPLNVFNEKIYIFLWFWFIGVAVISSFGVLYRCGTVSERFRSRLLKTRAKLVSGDVVESVTAKCRIGDWFMLYQIAKNMDESMYKSFIVKLDEEI